jgi:hypothetical protein
MSPEKKENNETALPAAFSQSKFQSTNSDDDQLGMEDDTLLNNNQHQNRPKNLLSKSSSKILILATANVILTFTLLGTWIRLATTYRCSKSNDIPTPPYCELFLLILVQKLFLKLIRNPFSTREGRWISQIRK